MPIDTYGLKVEICYRGAFLIPVLSTKLPPPTRFTQMFYLKIKIWKPANTGVEPGYSVTAL